MDALCLYKLRKTIESLVAFESILKTMYYLRNRKIMAAMFILISLMQT